MKRVLKSRRGVIIESAILFVVVLFVISILLTSIVLTAHNRAAYADTEMRSRLEIEQIGELFLTDTAEDDRFETAISDSPYERSLGEDENVLHLKTLSGRTVLYIEKSGDEALVWRYSKP